jgi:predicted ATP-binding protein involved in virulence
MAYFPTIYISCTSENKDESISLYKSLKIYGFQVSIDIFHGENTTDFLYDDMMPGDPLKEIKDSKRKNADVFLIVLTKSSILNYAPPGSREYIDRECSFAMTVKSKRKSNPFLIISVITEDFTGSYDIYCPQELADSNPLRWYGRDKLESLDKLVSVIKKSLYLSSSETTVKSIDFNAVKKGQELFISKVEIKNIKCFKDLILDFNHRHIDRWTMLLGDNAIGKSTLLKCIALGLCNASDAAALTRISEMNSEFIRTGETQASITIELQRSKLSKNARKKYRITTTITKDATGTSEEISQEVNTPSPDEKFPWADIFVCGYGASRSQAADTSHERYKIFEAVQSLFSHEVRLQNPELILLRQDPAVRILLQEKLQNILMLDEEDYQIDAGKTGLNVVGPWGKVNFNKLSDGYRSTTLWVLDFLGWLIYAGRLGDNNEIGGILILDELEQHLHPRWQRNIVELLRCQFPKTQIIASTHTPLVAAGVADIEESCLLKLERDENNNEIKIVTIDQSEIAGKRADQILTSSAFDLLTTRNNKSHDEVDRYTELLAKTSLTTEESAELEHLQPLVKSRLTISETPIAQRVEQLLDEALQKIAHEHPPAMLDLEVKKQLQALFESDDEDL